MKSYLDSSVQEYLDELNARKPVPGGGSAAALVAALGVGLISMVAEYSKGKSSFKTIEKKIDTTLLKSHKIQKRLTVLVDEDAQAYLDVVRTRQAPKRQKNAALKHAARVPLEVAKLCYDAIELTPFLVSHGNKNLLSDVEIAIEFLFAAYNASIINIDINQ